MANREGSKGGSGGGQQGGPAVVKAARGRSKCSGGARAGRAAARVVRVEPGGQGWRGGGRWGGSKAGPEGEIASWESRGTRRPRRTGSGAAVVPSCVHGLGGRSAARG